MTSGGSRPIRIPRWSCPRSGDSASRSPRRAIVPPESPSRCPGSRPSRMAVRAAGGTRAWWSTCGTCRRSERDRGRPDPVWWIGDAFLRLPRPWGGYRRRRGLLQSAAVHRRASRRRLGAQHAHARDAAGALRRAGGARALLLRLGPLSSRRPPLVAHHPRPRSPRCSPCPGSALTRTRRPSLQAAACDSPRSGSDSSGGGRSSMRSRRSPTRLGVACTIETAADDATVTRAYREAAVAVCPEPLRGIRSHADRGSGVGNAGRGVGHPAASGVRRSLPRGWCRSTMCRPSPRRSWTRSTSPPADPALVAELTIPRRPRGFLAALRAVPWRRLGHGPASAADVRLSADRRRHRAVDGGAGQAVSRRARWSCPPGSTATRPTWTPPSPTGSIGSVFRRAGSARIQGLLLWSRRVAVLARSTDAEFIWCGNIKPAAYPAKWTMERTGHAVRHPAPRRRPADPAAPDPSVGHEADDRARRCSAPPRCSWPTASGPAIAA